MAAEKIRISTNLRKLEKKLVYSKCPCNIWSRFITLYASNPTEHRSSWPQLVKHFGCSLDQKTLMFHSIRTNTNETSDCVSSVAGWNFDQCLSNDHPGKTDGRFLSKLKQGIIIRQDETSGWVKLLYHWWRNPKTGINPTINMNKIRIFHIQAYNRAKFLTFDLAWHSYQELLFSNNVGVFPDCKSLF